MATEAETSEKEPTTPTPTTGASLPSVLPQKRIFEEDHTPTVPSPLNPDLKPQKAVAIEEMPATTREKPSRAKKESLKKRESKGAFTVDSSRATPDPKHKDPPTGEFSPARYKLAPPKQSDFEPPKGPVFTSHHEVVAQDGAPIEFFETSDHVYNKKNFHYTHCIADPAFPSSIYYRQTEPEPHGPHMSFEDAATHMYFDETGHHVTTDKGFRMARANVAVREGRWYWECKITQGIVKQKRGEPELSHGHVRMGFARREASLDAPVGFDAYSYGIRDKEGHKVHMSRPKPFFPPDEDIREGDVIGLEIQLPSERLQRKVLSGHYNPAVDLVDEPDPGAEASNIVRDRIPIRFKSHIYFEKIDYHTTKELEDLMNPSPATTFGSPSEPPHPNHPIPALRTLPNSYIKIYKNGVPMGTAFDNLLAFLPPASKQLAQVGAREGLDDGMLGYYPAVSVFRMGAAQVNFGPNFWFPPPTGDEDAEDEVDMIGQEPGISADATGAQKTQLRPLSGRFAEQIVEDIVYDIVDEVDFWMQDGGRVIDRVGRDEKAGSIDMAPGREEIKELVQDDY